MNLRLSIFAALGTVLFCCSEGGAVGPSLEQRQANLTKIGVALQEYRHGTNDQPAYSRPDDGDGNDPKKPKLGLSWRVHLLALLDGKSRELFKRFDLDEPWDGPNNSKLIPLMPDLFRSAGATKQGETCFHVLLGPADPKHPKQFIFNDRLKEERLNEKAERQLATFPWAGGVTDGTSNTIIVVEAGPPTAQPWTKPGGLLVDLEHPKAALSKKDDDLWVLMGDGKVRNLSLKKVDEALFLAMLTRMGGENLKNPPPIAPATPKNATAKSEPASRPVASTPVKPNGLGPAQPSPANPEMHTIQENPENATVIELDDEVLDAVIGGEGTKWCLLLRKSKRIAIFDASEGKLTGSIPLKFKSILMAAGADKLLVADTYDGTIERYDLGTLAKEATGTLPKDGITRMLCLGAASSGPLLLSISKDSEPLGISHLMSLDIKTLKAKPVVFTEKQPPRFHFPELHFRASADGRVVGYWDATLRLNSIVFSKAGAVARSLDGAGVNVVPSPDGTLLTRLGIYSPEMDHLRKCPVALLIPAQRGTSYLKIVSPSRAGNFGERPKPARVVLYPNIEERTGLHLREILVSIGGDHGNPGDFTEDKRFLFCPDEKSLGWIPPTNDRLLLFKADPQSPSNRPEITEAPAVTSQPPKVEVGKEFRYAIVVDPNPSDLAFKIKAGPPGMMVADDGTVTWNVPSDFIGSSPAVITISDRYGLQIEHMIPLNNPVGRSLPGRPVTIAQPSRRDAQSETAPNNLKPENASVIQVEDGIADAVVGGAGTKWCLVLQVPKRVAIFDASRGAIAGYIPLPRNPVFVAAGAEKLLIADRVAKTIERYDLTTLAKEASGTLPKDGTVNMLCLGSASSGPLILGIADETPKGYLYKLMSVDVTTLKATPITVDPKLPTDSIGRGHHFRSSPDGNVIGAWKIIAPFTGLDSLVIAQERATYRYVDEPSIGSVAPNSEGMLLTSNGIYSSELKLIRAEPATLRIPAQRGKSYLKIVLPDHRPNIPPMKVVYFANTEQETGLHLKDISLTSKQIRSIPTDITLDKRFLFCPDEKMLGCIPHSNDRLYLFKIDLESPSNQPERKPLVVTSKPPAIELGKEFKYSITVEPNLGDLKFRREFGPGDMKVSEDGTVTWNVPPKWLGKPDAAITISDSTGQSVLHNISLSVPQSASPSETVPGTPSPKKNMPVKKTSQ